MVSSSCTDKRADNLRSEENFSFSLQSFSSVNSKSSVLLFVLTHSYIYNVQILCVHAFKNDCSMKLGWQLILQSICRYILTLNVEYVNLVLI